MNNEEMRIVIEGELKKILDEGIPEAYCGMREFLAYHMGWEGPGAGLEAQGKRIRPVLVLLCAISAGGDWQAALPAAAAVEYVHNFSLIHDDIQDQSPLRRGRETVWVKWGIAQAINAGDLMFTLAFVALQKLAETLSPTAALQAHHVLQATCIRLTGGQYLDLAYEKARQMPDGAYWPMIEGKTAALLACCAELGALAGRATSEQRSCYREFGIKLGLAFQVQDDWLGIWGNAAQTGKSTESDLVSGKKTFPVSAGLANQSRFAKRWMAGPVFSADVPEVIALLEKEGIKEKTLQTANKLTNEALAAFDQASPTEAGKQMVNDLVHKLLTRDN